MKNNNIKTFVAIGIGAALFFVLGRFVAIPSPVPNTNISLQYAVLGLRFCVRNAQGTGFGFRQGFSRLVRVHP